jgi:hypothetical protein
MIGTITALALAASSAQPAKQPLLQIDRDCKPVSARMARTAADKRFGPLLRSCRWTVMRHGQPRVMVVRLYAPRPANSRTCKKPEAWIKLYTITGDDGSVGFSALDSSDSNLALDPANGNIHVRTPKGWNTIVDVNTDYANDESFWDMNPTNDFDLTPPVTAASECRKPSVSGDNGDNELIFCAPHDNQDYYYALTVHYAGAKKPVRIDPDIINH